MRPPIWRRLLMSSTMTLGDLHQAVQAAMGWRDCHLHAFDIDGQQYGDRHTTDDIADENRLTLNGLLKSGIARFGYTYDFGDNWEHTVAIEKIQPAANGTSYPACVAGKRNCPPEVLRRLVGLPASYSCSRRPRAPRTRRAGRVGG